MKALFEKWIVSHFGDHMKSQIEAFDEEDGYLDQTVNAMWIVFCGYAILKGDI